MNLIRGEYSVISLSFSIFVPAFVSSLYFFAAEAVLVIEPTLYIQVTRARAKLESPKKSGHTHDLLPEELETAFFRMARASHLHGSHQLAYMRDHFGLGITSQSEF